MIKSSELQKAIKKAQYKRQLIIFSIQSLFAVNIFFLYRQTSQVSLLDFFHIPILALILIYMLVAGWSLYRSYISKQSPKDVILGIIIDNLLLCEVIFYLHDEVLSSDFRSFDSSLFFYFYLFIALRSLHLNSSYIVISGFLSILSWFSLVFIISNRSQQSFDSSFLLSSGSVDRFLSVIGMSAILGYLVHEARKHFESSIARAIAGQGLARFVSEAVAAEVIFSKEILKPGQGRLQSVAILMMDIRGFTTMALNSAPSETMSLLHDYQQLMEPVILKHGGCIDKFMGDGILAHFGAINLDPRYAAQALRCIEHLIYTTEQWNDKRIFAGLKPLEFGIACAVGEALVGLVGGRSKLEFTIIGNPVNLTAKLEKHLKSVNARAITTKATFELAQRQGFTPVYPRRAISSANISGFGSGVDLVIMCDQKKHSATEIKTHDDATLILNETSA